MDYEGDSNMSAILEEQSHTSSSSTTNMSPTTSPAHPSSSLLSSSFDDVEDSRPTGKSARIRKPPRFEDEPDTSSNHEDMTSESDEKEEREKDFTRHRYDAPEESLHMPQRENGDDNSSGSGSDSVEFDRAIEQWENEVHKSDRSSDGTERHGNRGTSKADQMKLMEQWGNMSLPVELDAGEIPIHSSIARWKPRRQSQYPDPCFDEEFNSGHDKKDDYMCCGCIKKEFSASNPALAMAIICCQIVIVIIFVMIFLPSHNDQGVSNSTIVPAYNGNQSWTSEPTIPTTTLTQAPTIPTLTPDNPAPTTVEPLTVFTPPPYPSPVSVPTTARPTEPPTTTTSTGTPTSTPPTTTPTTLVSTTTEPVVTENPTTDAPTTNAPTPFLLGTISFLEWLPEETQDVIDSEFQSPQARAFDWMLSDPNLNTYGRTRVLQRFALACLYYATQGDDWGRSTGWLDYDVNECEWQHVGTNSAIYSSNRPICTTQNDYQSIQLANNNLRGTIPAELQLLSNLQVLDLSQNIELSGSIPDAIIEECFDLQLIVIFENSLTGSIPTAVAELPDLQSFHAWDNLLTGPAFPEGLLARATNLRHWHVGSNALTGTFPTTEQLERQSTSTPYFLMSLWFYGNQLTGPIPPSGLEKLTRLTSLLGWGNRLTGTLPPQIGLLRQLEQLDLEANMISGPIPTELGLLSSQLQGLWLSSNSFTSTIPVELGDLRGLTVLSLHNNSLTGTMMTEIGRLTSLYEFSCQGNSGLNGTIPTQIGNMRSLRSMQWESNQLVGPVPTEMGRMTNLELVHLFQNQLTSSLPSELGQLFALQDLLMQNNILASTIPTELGRLRQLNDLYLNGNQMTGAIPSELGLLSSRLTVLDLSDNQLASTIPIEFRSLIVGQAREGGRLEQLRLFRNQLVGSLSTDLFPGEGGGSPLTQLDLSYNQLSSTIPIEIGTLTNLQFVSFVSNRMNGTIPTQIGLIQPVSLELKDNQLIGAIPTEIGMMKDRLVKLDLSGNRLTSFIPTEVGELLLLSSLSLNLNALLWTIPPELGLLHNSLRILHLNVNNLAGSLPSEVGRLTKLEEFRLDDNPYLFGSIPTEELAGLTSLQGLTLSGTSLTGALPADVCDMNVLQVDCAVPGNSRSGVCGCDCACR